MDASNMKDACQNRLPIYVINLPTSVDRRRGMRKQFDEVGLKFEFVDAVYGAELTETELRRFVHYDTMILGKNEFGCLLSHVKCWEKFLASDSEAAIICEDDIYVSANFVQCLEELWVPPDEICLIRLETMLATATAVRKPVQRGKNFSVLRLLTTHAGAACYVINRVTAQMLAVSWKDMRHMIDNELFSPDCRNIPPLTIYQVVPAPCIQHNILFPAKQIISDIGTDREDAKLGYAPYRQSGGFKEHIKNVLRPIHRKIYSLALMFNGKRRIKIRYG
jgi:glycosyl transferase, family 25